MKDIQVSEYPTRAELESAIQNMTDVSDVRIVGTIQELAKVGLSESTTVYGVSCTANDTTQPAPTTSHVSRGSPSDFGLNGKHTKPPQSD